VGSFTTNWLGISFACFLGHWWPQFAQRIWSAWLHNVVPPHFSQQLFDFDLTVAVSGSAGTVSFLGHRLSSIDVDPAGSISTRFDFSAIGHHRNYFLFFLDRFARQLRLLVLIVLRETVDTLPTPVHYLAVRVNVVIVWNGAFASPLRKHDHKWTNYFLFFLDRFARQLRLLVLIVLRETVDTLPTPVHYLAVRVNVVIVWNGAFASPLRKHDHKWTNPRRLAWH